MNLRICYMMSNDLIMKVIKNVLPPNGMKALHVKAKVTTVNVRMTSSLTFREMYNK